MVKAVPTKTAPPKKVSTIKIIQPKPKPGPRGTSEIELVLAKPVRVSKKFYFSYVPISSRGQLGGGRHASQTVSECASHLISFDNLTESSPDSCKPSPSGSGANVPPPPPITTPG
jgi:hypothetical protein